MHRRTSRLNRVTLIVIGLLIALGGAYLVARSRGWLHRWTAGQSADDKLYTAAQARWLHDNDWVWFAVAAAAIVVGLLTLRWLFVQARIDRVSTLRVDTDPEQHGRTVLSADVLTGAVEDQILDYPGVERVRSLIIGAADDPELIVRVIVHPIADVAGVRDRILAEALPAARTAMDAPVPAQVHVHVTGRRQSDRIVL